MNYQNTMRSCQMSLAAALLLSLSACGGDGGGGGKSVSRNGQVYMQKGVANAQVCVDLQGSGGCSANAASATRTGADGSFQISFQAPDDAAAQRFAAAPLIAEIAADQVQYKLSAPAAKGDEINPLTTLVQGHIQRTGASLADAERALAQQLGIEIGHIYKYQDQPGTIVANARTVARLIEAGFAMGTPMQVHAASDAPDFSPRLTSFNYKDAGNYESYLYRADGSANSNGQVLWDPTYSGLIAGLARTGANASGIAEVRNSAAYSGREDYLRTRGNPTRVQISANNKSMQWLSAEQKEALKNDAALFELALEEVDISNLPMAEFVKSTQAYEAKAQLPIEHSLFTLDAQVLGTAVFPAGSRLYRTLRTRFSAFPEPAATPGSSFSFEAIIGRTNDLPKPATVLGGFREPLSMQQSINATAWNAMKAALAIP